MQKEISLNTNKSLYMQIKDSIKEQIRKGDLKAGDRVPSERELCQMFGVSRITVRQAINEAVQEGLLYTIQGKGTFIVDTNGQKINQGLVKITSFSETMQNRGINAKTKLLSHSVQQADFGLSKILNIDITNEVLSLYTLGMGNEQIMVLYESYFELSLGKKILESALNMVEKEAPFSSTDLYTRTGIRPSHVDQTFEAVTADEEMAALMNIQRGHPLFLISSIIYDGDSNPLEYRKSFYRADKYKFHIQRKI